MDVSETDAIVLNCQRLWGVGPTHCLLQRNRGKLKGIAKGARRSKKRFVHTFEPCSLVRLTYRARKGLVWIEACSLVEPHLGLRTDLKRWGYAALISEIMLEMVPEGEPQPELFSLLQTDVGPFGDVPGPGQCGFAVPASLSSYHGLSSLPWKGVECATVP